MNPRTKRVGKRFLSLFLSLAMVLSLTVPMASAEENPEGIKFKNMMMQVLRTGDFVSHYDYASKENTAYKPFNFNQNDTWVDLNFTISYSQSVDLQLYKLKEEYIEEIEKYGSTVGFSVLESFIDASYPQFGAYKPEEFLDGDPIGYLKGIRFTGNIIGNEGDAQVQYKKVTQAEWATAIADAVFDNSPDPVVAKDLYAFGYGGQSYRRSRELPLSWFAVEILFLRRKKLP